MSLDAATTTSKHDPLGRFEVGFPFRRWPLTRELEDAIAKVDKPFDADAYEALQSSVDLRWVSDEELGRIIAVLGGFVPIYRSVYRFEEPEDGTRPSERKTAVVDHCFWEFEHVECGELCQHTMREVRKFGHWLLRNRMQPQVIFSGGKSLHVYVHTDAVKLKTPHPTIRSVCRKMVEKARVVCWDPAANLALAQIARVPNAQNSKTGLYAIPLSFEDVVRRPISYIKDLAREPQGMHVAPVIRSPTLAAVLTIEDDAIQTRQMVDELLPPKVDLKEGEVCAYLQRILHNGVSDGQGRHHAVVAVIDHYRLQGLDRFAVRKMVDEWNLKNKPPLSPGIIGHQIDAQFRRETKYSPCAMLRTRGLHPKKPCTSEV